MAKKSKGTKKSTAARTPNKPARSGARGSMSIATNSRRAPEERVAALKRAPLAVCENEENLESVLNLLRNKEEPMDVRLAALQTLQAASFSVIAFEPCRGEYIAALREVAADADPELRQR